MGQEICEDGIDNDLDGFIDNYDEDCICDFLFFNAQCELGCETDINPNIDVKTGWISEVVVTGLSGVGYILNDGAGHILTNSREEYLDSFINQVTFLTYNGNLDRKINIDTSINSFLSSFAISDLNKDGSYDIITKGDRQIFHRYDVDGNRIWSNDNYKFDLKTFNYKIADINEDGIAEIYMGNKIFNSQTGVLLFEGEGSAGCNFFSPFNECSLRANSIAADVTNHPGLELVCGNMVYEVNLNNLVDSVGNTANMIVAPSKVSDGFPSVADMDGDGLLDIVVVRSNQLNDGGVWIWNPRTELVIGEELPSITRGDMGGVAILSDLDSDCSLEVVVPFFEELRVYKYDGFNLSLDYNLPSTDQSGAAGATVFDLNGDGIQEIMFRDESTFRIIDGPGGQVIFNTPMFGGTFTEYPIVTSFDDGEAKILVTGGPSSKDTVKVFCFESATTPWMPARKVWNQPGYHVTNVNDDLTIPQYQQNSAAFFDTDSCFQETCPQVYNTFGVQATYRTQKGCVVFPERDLDPVEISASLDTICAMDSVTLSIVTDESEIRWYTPDLHDCTDCDSITISLDTSTWITVIVGDDRCFVEDSILIHVTKPTEYTQTKSICEGDSIFFDGFYLKEEGTYNRLVEVCDSLIILELEVLAPVSESITRSFCEGDSVVIETEVFKDGGNYQINTTSTESCDSIINLTVEIYAPSVLDTTVTICDGDSIFVDGVWYGEDELIMIEETNALGCDSTVMMIIDLVDILSDQDTVRICEGDSTMLHGAWQSLPGAYSDMFTSVSGCDSIFTYHLVVRDTSVVELNETICEGDTFFIDNMMFTEAAFYTFSVMSSTLCDSTINLALTVTESLRQTIDLMICEGDSILISDMWISTESSFDVVKENEDVCDSILTYNIAISDYLTDDQEIQNCGGDTLFLDGSFYTTDTILVDTIAGLDCPTIRFRNVIFSEPIVGFSDIELCFGDTFTTSTDTIIDFGVAQEVFQATNGCDSMVTYTISFIEQTVQAVDLFICAGDSILIGDEYYFDEVAFTDTLIGTYCDSIINYNLSLLSSDTSMQSFVIVDGLPVVVNNEEYTQVGEYQQIISNTLGCDSILLISISAEDSEDLIYPNIFSPNADNINDEWILDLTDFPGNEISIYDRWGNKVAQWQNQSEVRWNGQFNGNALMQGVYVFVLKYVDGTESKIEVGDLTLIR